jgi:hypothetical protein
MQFWSDGDPTRGSSVRVADEGDGDELFFGSRVELKIVQRRSDNTYNIDSFMKCLLWYASERLRIDESNPLDLRDFMRYHIYTKITSE